MKNIKILPVLLLLMFVNCEKVVEIDVASIPPKLIIDASFEVYFDETPVTAKTNVKLTLSADYFDTAIPAVLGAKVFVTNLNDINIINFLDTDEDGVYEPQSTFIPEDDIEYELTVIYDNETYKGKATKVKSAKFINVMQGDKTLFTGKETEVIIEFSDDINAENFYLVHYTDNRYDALEDRFFNGTQYNKSEFFDEDDLDLPETINISMSGVTKEYFTYFRILINQSGENSGGPFQSVPSSLLGNMINTTNDSNFPLGYFHISETDIINLDLVEKN